MTSTAELVTAAAVALGGLAALGWALRREPDTRWAAEVPGLEPPRGAADAAPVAEVPALAGRAGPVEFAPPKGITPACAGVLLVQTVRPVHVAATIVDLAVRGHLRVDHVRRTDGAVERRYVLLERDQAGLAPYEQAVKDALFRDAESVTESAVAQRFQRELPTIEARLWDAVDAAGWFRGSARRVGARWLRVATLTLLASFAVAQTAIFAGHDAVGYGVLVPAVAFVLLHRLMPVRTPAGSAALARVLGFRRYVFTAERDDLLAEERAGRFARYLPWAMVFGLAWRYATVPGQPE